MTHSRRWRLGGPRAGMPKSRMPRSKMIDLAPLWRHDTFMVGSVLTKRPRQSLRLDPQVWGAIDRERSRRPGSISRNTWINEAILEKLSRDQAGHKPRRASSA